MDELKQAQECRASAERIAQTVERKYQSLQDTFLQASDEHRRNMDAMRTHYESERTERLAMQERLEAAEIQRDQLRAELAAAKAELADKEAWIEFTRQGKSHPLSDLETELADLRGEVDQLEGDKQALCEQLATLRAERDAEIEAALEWACSVQHARWTDYKSASEAWDKHGPDLVRAYRASREQEKGMFGATGAAVKAVKEINDTTGAIQSLDDAAEILLRYLNKRMTYCASTIKDVKEALAFCAWHIRECEKPTPYWGEKPQDHKPWCLWPQMYRDREVDETGEIPCTCERRTRQQRDGKDRRDYHQPLHTAKGRRHHAARRKAERRQGV